MPATAPTASSGSIVSVNARSSHITSCSTLTFSPQSFRVEASDVGLRVLKEAFRDGDVRHLLVCELTRRAVVQAINRRAWTCHQDWRMGRDDELPLFRDGVAN